MPRAVHRFKNQTRRLLVEALYEAQGRLCASCGKPMYLQTRHAIIVNIMDYASIDHLYARNIGGGDDVTNKVAMHVRCNSSKGNRLPTACELIFHQLVLEKLEMVEAASAIANIPAARHVYGEPSTATLGDLWPKEVTG